LGSNGVCDGFRLSTTVLLRGYLYIGIREALYWNKGSKPFAGLSFQKLTPKDFLSKVNPKGFLQRSHFFNVNCKQFGW